MTWHHQRFRQDIKGALPKSQCPGKALLGCFAKGTFSRGHVSGRSGWDPVTSPRSAGCCRGGGIKLGHGLLPGRGLCPQAELPEDVPRSSESRRSLEGAARLTPWTTPLQLGRLLGGQGQGSPLGRCRFPVDAECHLLLPAAPGVFSRTPRRGLLLQLGHPVRGPRADPKAGEHLRGCQGAACRGTASVFPWPLP